MSNKKKNIQCCRLEVVPTINDIPRINKQKQKDDDEEETCLSSFFFLFPLYLSTIATRVISSRISSLTCLSQVNEDNERENNRRANPSILSLSLSPFIGLAMMIAIDSFGTRSRCDLIIICRDTHEKSDS